MNKIRWTEKKRSNKKKKEAIKIDKMMNLETTNHWKQTSKNLLWILLTRNIKKRLMKNWMNTRRIRGTTQIFLWTMKLPLIWLTKIFRRMRRKIARIIKENTRINMNYLMQTRVNHPAQMKKTKIFKPVFHLKAMIRNLKGMRNWRNGHLPLQLIVLLMGLTYTINN